MIPTAPDDNMICSPPPADARPPAPARIPDNGPRKSRPKGANPAGIGNELRLFEQRKVRHDPFAPVAVPDCRQSDPLTRRQTPPISLKTCGRRLNTTSDPHNQRSHGPALVLKTKCPIAPTPPSISLENALLAV